jgi:adenylate cyclase
MMAKLRFRLEAGDSSDLVLMSKASRRLAAIMFTDIVGYSVLTQKNERQALKDLEEHRQLLRSNFEANDGTEINAMGDAFLVEFSSSLNAVRCATAIQRILSERNTSLPQERTIRVRIGIHLGDVLSQGDDVYGDAVNIASRLEPLAAPGGVCVSQNVADDVRNKIGFPVVRLGRYELKNVESPVEVYRIVMPWEEERPEELARPKRQRIAVLPLANISPDRNDEYLADGMTDELISTLSNIANLGVIARTSVVHYLGTSKGIYDIARELNVEAVLDGSVRRSGNKIRITVRLIDGLSEEHLWSKKFDKELEDILVIQSEIADNVAEAMKVDMKAKEKFQIVKKAATNTAAHTLYFKGRYHWNRRNEASLKAAVECFEAAIREAPEHALSYVGLADCYRVMGGRGFTRPEEAKSKARALAERALDLDDTLAEAHAALAGSLEVKWDWLGAEREFLRAIQLNPSYASAYQWYALHLGHSGRFEKGIEAAKRAVELDPLSPVMVCTLFEEYFLARHYEMAIEQCDRVMELEPDFPLARYSLAHVYIQKGMLDKAIAELEKATSQSAEAEYKAVLAYAYAVSGPKGRAKEIYDELAKAPVGDDVSAPNLAVIHVGLGEKDEAFALLAKACEGKSDSLRHLLVSPLYDSLRSDPRFDDLLEKTGVQMP